MSVSVRSAGVSPHPVATGLAPDCDRQSDPAPPDRAGYRDSPRAAGPSLFDILNNRADDISQRKSDLIVGLY